MLAAGGVSAGSVPPKQRSHFHMSISSGWREAGKQTGDGSKTASEEDALGSGRRRPQAAPTSLSFGGVCPGKPADVDIPTA